MKNKKLTIIGLLWLFVSSSFVAHAGVRTVHMTSKSVRTVWIKPGQGVVLNFPIKPTKAILGSGSSFKLEYVQNDLVIGATQYGRQTNLFVYLEGRRFAFRLVTSKSKYDDIILVRDKGDSKIKLEMK